LHHRTVWFHKKDWWSVWHRCPFQPRGRHSSGQRKDAVDADMTICNAGAQVGGIGRRTSSTDKSCSLGWLFWPDHETRSCRGLASVRRQSSAPSCVNP
jgi:hypothetical protein